MSRLSAMSIANSALVAFGNAMNVHTHNVANVNTDGFQPHVASYSTGPDGQGVRLHVRTPERRGDATGVARGGCAAAADLPNPGNTDLGTEFTHMIVTEHAHAANVATARTVDDMLGMLLDMKL